MSKVTATSAVGHDLGHTSPVGPFQHQSPQTVWVVCTTAQIAVGRLNWAHPWQGVSSTQIVWGSFLCPDLFADDLSGFALDHSPPGELGANTIHLPDEGAVAAEARLVVDALLEDFAA